LAKIAFVVERPTQFEVPFFRHAAADSAHDLRVVFTDPGAGSAAVDPELGRAVDWGFDLRAGYDWAAPPQRAAVGWMRRELARGYDLVIVNGYTQRHYLSAAVVARRQGSATALRLDSALFEPFSTGRKIARRMLFRALDRLFDLYLGVGTLADRYLAACGVAEPRRGEFPYAVDVEWFRTRAAAAPHRAELRSRFGVPADAPLILAVAKLHPREAPWDLLRALPSSDLWGRTPYLWLAGDGPQRAEIERYLATHSTATRLLGYVPYTELPSLYAAADLFVHAPQEERWGVSVGEALACGLPVIAGTRVGAAHDLVVPGRNGFLYRTGSPDSLRESILQALTLDRDVIAATSSERLERWGYARAWASLVAAAETMARREAA
jgi:glycosyltransferase involved in cell wall biosynthesis